MESATLPNAANQKAQDQRLGDFAQVDRADSDDLVKRLDAMHALDAFRAYKKVTFDLLRLAPGARTADVGCGTGDDVRSLLDRVGPEGEAVGFDLSEAMLAQARARHAGIQGIRFAAAHSDGLDATDAYFDGIRADRVLIHVPIPASTLKEMLRVTRPGGRIVISEPDMPGCWAASDDYGTTDRVMREIANSCRHPYLARDLWAMFKDAGLDDVSLTVKPVTAFDPVSVGRILDFSGVVTSMVTRGLLGQDEAAVWAASLAERGRTGRFVVGVNIIIAAGTKV